VKEDERLQLPQLWVVEIASGKSRRLTGPEQYVWWVRWSPDSRSIAFLTSPTGKPDDGQLQDIGVVAVGGGPTRRLGVIGAPFAWSPDGRWIACATSVDRASHVAKSDLWVIPARGGLPVNLTADFDEDARTPAWNPTSDTLAFHAAQGVTTVVATVALPEALRGAVAPDRSRGGAPAGRASTTNVAAEARAIAAVVLSTDRNAEAGAPAAARDGAIAWVQSSAVAPTELWIADHPRLPGAPASAVNAPAAGLDVGEIRRVSWTSSDGVTVGGLLLRPPGAPARGALKTLVQLHGGPYTDRNALAFQTLPLFFAARGYQIFLPNFRSSGGYGTAFMVRRRADWGGQDWRDVTSGLDSLVAWGLADPKRLGLYGRSYGGYLTTWGITQTDRFDAASVFAGAVDLSALWGQSDVQRYRAFEFEGRPWETPSSWARSSPMTHIANVRTPTLIQVGDHDARVPLAQSQQLYRALLALGVPVEFVHYPREGHVPREPRHRADMLLRMLAWWDRWVK
jgi:dipeptidyl aminopeptidase/acylaminoacyl peptidase